MLLENKLDSAYKKLNILKNPPKSLISSVTKQRQINKISNIVLTGSPARLTSDIVVVSEEKVIEGTLLMLVV